MRLYQYIFLFPFELLTILPLSALSVAIPVSTRPACLPSIPVIPTDICFIQP